MIQNLLLVILCYLVFCDLFLIFDDTLTGGCLLWDSLGVYLCSAKYTAKCTHTLGGM